jgi:hypothetical protein
MRRFGCGMLYLKALLAAADLWACLSKLPASRMLSALHAHGNMQASYSMLSFVVSVMCGSQLQDHNCWVPRNMLLAVSSACLELAEDSSSQW